MIHARPAERADQPDAVEIVAELGGRVVGTVTVWRESANIYYATALHVDREHRRQGVGTRLMAAAEAHAAAHGARIRVTIAENNLAARAFFGAIGLS
jgi:ribosomal protein S18 acetylase RimI-like enzyme